MKYDALIIGFGKAGKTLAAYLAQQGKKVALVEKSSRMYGGTCINVGCIPSKSLVLSAAKSAADPEKAFEAAAERYKNAVLEKRRLVAMLNKKNFDKLDLNPNVTVVDGTARFLDPNTVEVAAGIERMLLSADKIYINTGSVSVVPRIEGIANNPHVYFSDTLMDEERLPKRLAIVGGGYIGLEFASMYANFGAEVTVFQDGDKFLPREDADVAEEIKRILEKQGVEFKLGVKILSVDDSGGLHYMENEEPCSYPSDAVLLATGRRPNTDELNLSAANVEMTSRGGIVTDDNLKTTQEGIYAMGDVRGGLQFTYYSLDDYRIIVSGLTGGSYTNAGRKNIPYNVFMATPFARVGMNETEAKAAGVDYRLLKLPVAAIPKAHVMGKTEGFLKALVDGGGKILGAMLICEESYEMINIVKLAMDMNADYTVLRDQIFTHPTMSEALNDLFSL